MNCPACDGTLITQKVGTIKVDRCPQCGGFWLDAGELAVLAKQMSELDIVPRQHLRVVWAKPVSPLQNSQRRCPRCHIILRNFNYCYNSNILLDRCPQCHGMWADAGELAAIAIYVKGHPKLDRMAAAIADHVRGFEKRKWAAEDVAAFAGSPPLYSGKSGWALLVVAIVEALRRFNRND